MIDETQALLFKCAFAWWEDAPVELIDGGIRSEHNAIRTRQLRDDLWCAWEDEYDDSEDVSIAYGPTVDDALRELICMAGGDP